MKHRATLLVLVFNLGMATGPLRADEPPKSTPLDELLLFFPTRYPEGDWKPAGLQFQDVWFNAADGTRLHGWYCSCDRPRAIVLYAHGNGGNLSNRAGRLRFFQEKLRVTVLAFDYRGYGRSAGAPTVAGVVDDARAARAFLARKAGVPEAEVVLMGHSLGGAVVAQLAADTRPRALILESTFASLRETAAFHYPKLAWLVPADKLDSAAKLAKVDCPLLQCHGDADQAIPFAHGQRLFDAACGPKRFVRIPGGDHNDPPTAAYNEELDRFIAKLATPQKK